MFKTVSGCNLDCNYCYYRRSVAGSGPAMHVRRDVIEAFMPAYMRHVADSHQASLSWQGGEPTLAGLDFFREAVSTEARFAIPPMSINNALQTNGVLIDDTWAEFLAEYNFLVGVSLDGPEPVHDVTRKDVGGSGSFRRVMGGIRALKRHSVDTNILCVLTQHNVRRAGELADFFLSEGLGYLQFMPGMAFKSSEPQAPASYLVSADEYGSFLTELFDLWYGSGVPSFSVRAFNNILQSLLGDGNDLCVHAEDCHAGLLVECNGDVYPCDFYIHPHWKLGNVLTHSLEDMAGGAKLREFSLRKRLLPPTCEKCDYVSLCRGECPRNRVPATDGTPGPGYFCASYKRLFRHSLPRFRELAGRLANYRRYTQMRKTSGNRMAAPLVGHTGCPCGSGRSYGTCCGDPALARSYLLRPSDPGD